MLAIHRICFFISFCNIFLFLYLNNVTAQEPENILNGFLAPEGSFKYYVSLWDVDGYICGGAIIHNHFVLTAAHCVRDIRTNKLFSKRIFVARKNGNSILEADVLGQVEKIYTLLSWSGGTNDIAVLKLQYSLRLDKNKNLAKIDLPIGNQNYEGQVAVSPGSGVDSTYPCLNATGHRVICNYKTDYRLKYLLMRIISNADCQKMQPALDINSGNICVKQVMTIPPVPQLVCFGDSGSPLVLNNVIIGVISLGPYNCSDSVSPTVYTKVSAYPRFISDAMMDKVNTETQVATFNPSYSKYV